MRMTPTSLTAYYTTKQLLVYFLGSLRVINRVVNFSSLTAPNKNYKLLKGLSIIYIAYLLRKNFEDLAYSF